MFKNDVNPFWHTNYDGGYLKIIYYHERSFES